MSQEQRELRRAAARAFMNSLEQLQDSLGSEKPDGKSPRAIAAEPTPKRRTQKPKAPLEGEPAHIADALEEAVADIEHFMQKHPAFPLPEQDWGEQD
ncbi:MAG: hypothetical protein VKJ24_06065 [Synechococcales bacterium]|nr:hypothetical protein [Synechococcales bacterium]